MMDITSAQPNIEPVAERTCRVCGCTDTRSCDPPCIWAEPELCSTCSDIEAEANGVRFLTAKAVSAHDDLILQEILTEGSAAGVVPPVNFQVALGAGGRLLFLSVQVADEIRAETVDLQALVAPWVSAIAAELRAQYLSKLVRP